VTDLSGYEGPVDRVSPYHFYQHTYWTLRGRWRLLLYDWMRRDPCDAAAAITPTETVAGERYTITLTVTAGATPLEAGARIAVYFPLRFGGDGMVRALPCFQGPDGQTGYGSRIVARAEREGVDLATVVHSTGTGFTCVEVGVETGRLDPGDAVDVVIGDPSCKGVMVSEQAKAFPFRAAIDFTGDDTFRPIVPNPTITNVGGRARYLRCFAPATPRPGEPFPVRVVAADVPNHNPSHGHSGRLTFTARGGAAEAPGEIVMPATCHGTMAVEGARVGENGVTRIQVIDAANGLMGRTNPICPEAAPEGLALYYGEIHSHTDLSDGGGTPDDSYRWARDVEGLDFSALADHFEDGQSYNCTLEEKWRITKEVTERYNDPGRFVTLLGYEIGTLEKHRNVYFADGEGRMIVEGPDGERVTMDNVFGKLAGADYVLIPHAPKFHGIDWRTPHDPERQRLVEIFSFWGNSEAGGPKSVRTALDLGYRFGFTGGTDNHAAEPGNPDIGGITGLYATALTRRAVFDALRARRTFATTGPRMIVTFEVNGAFMGGEVTADPTAARVVRGRAIAEEPIEAVEVIRNGAEAYVAAGDGRDDVTIEWRDTDPLPGLCPKREITDDRFAYYYLRVTTATGAIGWSSPVWVRNDEE